MNTTTNDRAYYDKMHKIGKLVTLISILIFCGVPFIVCMAYGVMPRLSDLLLAAGGLCAVLIPVGVAETFAEIPVMGSSYYVACVTGNILNLKLPAALNALKIAKVKQGTQAADVIIGVSVAVSSMVTLILLVIGVLLLAPLQPLLSTPAVGTAAQYVLPALFGCLTLGFIGNNVGGGIIIKKRLLAAVVPFIACGILYIVAPDIYNLGQGFVMMLCIPCVYFISKLLYKKGVITVDLPAEEEEEVNLTE
ncbi:MAG: hypothetical protein RR370_03110 [Synergistaceae bacterium]